MVKNTQGINVLPPSSMGSSMKTDFGPSSAKKLLFRVNGDMINFHIGKISS